MIDERTLPHDLAAEKAVLGSILIDNETVSLVSPILQPGEFFRAGHKCVYRHMLGLAETRTPIDPVTLRASLLTSGELDDSGGPAYISALTDGVPRATNVEAYARIVKDHSSRREVIAAANAMLAEAYDSDRDVHEMLDAAEKRLLEVSQARHAGALMSMSDIIATTWPVVQAQIEEATAKGDVIGLKTGFGSLDRMLNGLRPGQMMIVAARPGLGKTSLAMNMADFMTRTLKKTVAVFSLEMSREELFVRHLSSVAQVDSNELMRGRLGDYQWKRMADTLVELDSAPLYIDESVRGVFEIRSKCRALQQRVGLDAIIVDYIQLMSHEGDRCENRNLEIAKISRGFKLLAKELRVPIIPISQLNRLSEQRKDKRPQLSDLRESGALEQDADIVLFVHREEETGPQTAENKGKASLIVAKSRNGRKGEVEVLWHAEQTRFANLNSEEMF